MSDAMDVEVAAPEQQSQAPSGKLSRLQYERLKKKERKKKKHAQTAQNNETEAQKGAELAASTEDEVEVEYVIADPFATLGTPGEADADLGELRQVLSKFAESSAATPTVKAEASQAAVASAANAAASTSGDKAANGEEEKAKMSKKRRKALKRLPVAVLKQLVKRPDLVEIHDTCAANPFVLLHLKAYPNAVPVPRHWSQRRRYLQGKRGVEKAAFDLPDFIKKTGIMEIRGAAQDKDAASRLKSKSRERTQGTGTGKLDIDYKTLHDAFFRYQTKPRLTQYGDLYYEGKEYEVEMHEKRPGLLSPELREALGMPDGAPPPWLLAMQRFGPPPSYPNLRVAGVNAPLPSGAELGTHVGGWGRPGEAATMAAASEEAAPPIDTLHWGDLPPETLAEASDEEGGESGAEAGGGADSDEDAMMLEGAQDHGALASGLETPLGGLETPQHVEGTLRKSKALYEVLHEAPASVGSALMGSDRAYSRSAVGGGSDRVDLLKSQRTEAVELALAPEEIGKLTEEQLKKRYEKAVQERQNAAAPQGTKRKERDDSDDEDQGARKNKKKREFKF